MEQSDCLTLFRQVVINAKEHLPNAKDTFLTHSALSALSNDDFNIWSKPIMNNEKAKELLRTLLLFDCLPDRSHWQRHLEAPKSDIHSKYVMHGLSRCMDHQSQESTDIRWLKSMYFIIACQRAVFPQGFDIDEFRLYPDYGDQRAVRPTIRAFEMGLRSNVDDDGLPMEIPPEIKSKVPRPWHDEFWKEGFNKTECMPLPQRAPDEKLPKHYFSEFYNVYQQLSEHFIASQKNTYIDSRRDGAYGLVLYALAIATGTTKGNMSTRAEGRIALRTLVESYINLKFLHTKDSPKLWDQFRSYGVGQTKLAFLKNIREEDLPSFLDLRDLQSYINEDSYHEFADIKLQSWSDRNVRDMATEAGVKDFYDKYYDWSSGYVHGHWGAIRDTVFTICVNPLHRFHKIPFIMRLDMPSVLTDMGKITNLMLDLLNQMYPPFKTRIKHPEIPPSSSSELA